MKNRSRLSGFNGLNDVSDEKTLGFGWLTAADNVDVTKTGGLRTRDGYTLALSGSITAACAGERTLVVDGGALKEVMPDLSLVTLHEGMTSGPVWWAGINGQTFYSGENKGIVGAEWLPLAWDIPPPPVLSAGSGSLPAGTYRAVCTRLLPGGRETGSSDMAEITVPEGSSIHAKAEDGLLVYMAPGESYRLCEGGSWHGGELGVELVTQFLRPIPECSRQIAFWQGRLYAAEYFPGLCTTLVWMSEPLGYHLFREFFAISGEVRLLAPVAECLIVGTGSDIFAYDGSLSRLADYGVANGDYAEHGRQVFFWTDKGLCSAMPFENRTEKRLLVSPGAEASVSFVEKNGEKRAVVSVVAPGNE